jgi:tetratricopeptide (TPR) repeat protein
MRIVEADTYYQGHMVVLAYWAEQLAPLAPAIAAYLDQNPNLVAYRPMLSLAYFQAGEPELAAAEFDRVAADDFAQIPPNLLWFGTICLAAEACARVGDTTRAPRLYELILPYRTRVAQVGTITSYGPAERYLGLLAATVGDFERATEHFDAALAICEANGLRHVMPKLHADIARAGGQSEAA